MVLPIRKKTVAELAQIFFRLDGDPVSFENHRYMIDILNYQGKKKFMLCSRQVGKSTLMCFDLGTSVTARYINPLTGKEKKALRMTYVSPSGAQTTQFSVEKLKPLIMFSPRFKAAYYDSRLHNDVKLKEFKNGVQIYLRSAFRDADRIRGIPNDKMYIDEIQDMVMSLFYDMESSMDASPIQMLTMSGTPKSLLNTANQYWKKSTQTEWMVPCTHHSPMHWNMLDQANIGLNGLICDRCGNRIYPEFGQWVDTVPGAPLKGFHVTQLAVSWKQSPEKWREEIVWKMENWPQDKFMNETLGFAYGQANRPLTQKDMIHTCWPDNKAMLVDSSRFYDKPPKANRPVPLRWFAGIDWGEGRDKASYSNGKLRAASYTILTIGAYVGGNKFFIAHWKKFKGHEIKPKFVMKYIMEKIREWNVEFIAADWGHGWGMNDQLIDAFGLDRVGMFFESANLKKLYNWNDDADMFVLNRNAMMSRLIGDAKKQMLVLPKWEEAKEMSADFEAIFKEYNSRTGLMSYDHDPSEPDDSFHSSMLCKLAADMTLGIINEEMSA